MNKSTLKGTEQLVTLVDKPPTKKDIGKTVYDIIFTEGYLCLQNLKIKERKILDINHTWIVLNDGLSCVIKSPALQNLYWNKPIIKALVSEE